MSPVRNEISLASGSLSSNVLEKSVSSVVIFYSPRIAKIRHD